MGVILEVYGDKTDMYAMGIYMGTVCLIISARYGIHRACVTVSEEDQHIY